MTDANSENNAADTVFKNAEIYDGTGASPFIGSVAIKGDRITTVGNCDHITRQQTVDLTGQALAPGFIDVHTHDDRYLLTNPDMAPKVSQGVTTVVTGNCGMSLTPWPRDREDKSQFPFNLWLDRPEFLFNDVADYFSYLDRQPAATNTAVLIGHSTLRYKHMSDLQRPATASETEAMAESLDTALQAGAIGMSSGLYYPPAQAATQEEVTEVAKAMAPYDGIYTAHMRNEGVNLIDSIHETAAIARDAGVQLCISHHKASGTASFGKTLQSLPLLQDLIDQQRLTLDVYPYHASSTMLRPEWLDTDRRVIVTWSHSYPQHGGRELDDIAAEMGLSRADTAKALQPAGAVYFHLDEEDVQRVLKFPHAMVGSDGIPDDPNPHPRLWGTFARVLGHYARDLGLFSLTEAVHRMSGLPARQFGFRDRGEIRVGAYADLVAFTPEEIHDSASFAEPKQPAIGIHSVWVNGEAVWENGQSTSCFSGRPLRLSDTNRGQNLRP